MITEELKTKGGKMVKTSNGVASVSPAQVSLFLTTRLWVYAVLIYFKNSTWVKFGDHRCVTREEAEKYAYSETLGKLRGLGGSDDIKVITAMDVTDIAISIDQMYDPTLTDVHYRKGFDNVMRPFMPGKSGQQTNPFGSSSNEVHKVDDDKTLEEHIYEWETAIKKFKNGGVFTPSEEYHARPYLVELSEKIKNNQISKFLIAAATGAGKETSTLASIIMLHDLRFHLNNDILHGAFPTIPSTACELLEELSNVKGMWLNDKFIDFSRFKIYVSEQFANSYYDGLTVPARYWAKENVIQVNTTEDIPSTHEPGVVPLMIGSFYDVALKTGEKFHCRYESLQNRLGVLAIGEGHKCLSNDQNTLWKNIQNLKQKFLLVITGTPYDFIYNTDRDLYFTKDERVLFTRNDLYHDKSNNPNSNFKHYPDYRFYGLKGLNEEIIKELKKNPNWKDDANGFLHKKFFETNTDGSFKYETQIALYFQRMIGEDPFNPNGDLLNIRNAPGLCDQAKRHIIVALPEGTKGSSVSDYIPALVEMLSKYNSLGVYKPLITYDETLGERKEIIKEDKQPTITFTCIKDLTGANIGPWGSLIFMRPIGNSIKAFEQFTGRIGRPYEGKINCGVFLADPEIAMNIIVNVEEKISLEREENLSHSQVLERTLENYFFFSSNNGKYEQIDLPDFAKELEKLSSTGTYQVNLCVKKTKAPDDFDLKFSNSVKKIIKKCKILSNGNDKAKGKIKTVIKQLELDLQNKKSKDKHWNDMKKIHMAKARVFALMKGFTSIQQVVEYVTDEFINNELGLKQEVDQGNVAEIFGKGYEYIPLYMNDPNEMDILYSNRWIETLHDEKDVSVVLESITENMISQEEKGEVLENSEYTSAIVHLFCKRLKQRFGSNPINFIDPTAGRGNFIIFMLKIAPMYGLDLSPKKVYYNDIAPFWVEFFKFLNTRYSLGIPNENITCKDAKDLDMIKFKAGLTNVPFKGDRYATINGAEHSYLEHIVTHSFLNLLDDDGMLGVIEPRSFNSEPAKDYRTVTEPFQSDIWIGSTDWFIEKNSSNPVFRILDKSNSSKTYNLYSSLNEETTEKKQKGKRLIDLWLDNGTMVDLFTAITKESASGNNWGTRHNIWEGPRLKRNCVKDKDNDNPVEVPMVKDKEASMWGPKKRFKSGFDSTPGLLVPRLMSERNIDIPYKKVIKDPNGEFGVVKNFARVECDSNEVDDVYTKIVHPSTMIMVSIIKHCLNAPTMTTKLWKMIPYKIYSNPQEMLTALSLNETCKNFIEECWKNFEKGK